MKKIFIALIVGLSLSVIPLMTQADTGPKPGMLFLLENKTGGDAFPPIKVEYFSCSDLLCANPTLIGGVEVSGSKYHCGKITDEKIFYCVGFFWSSDLPRHQKIRITFSDRVRESGVFQLNEGGNNYYVWNKLSLLANKFHGQAASAQVNVDSFIDYSDWKKLEHYYYVEVRPHNLVVHPGNTSVGNYISALPIPLVIPAATLLTIIIELIIRFFFVRFIKVGELASRRFSIALIVINGISVPLLWLYFSVLPIHSYLLTIILWELAIILFEAGWYYLVMKRHIPFKGALAFSIAANAASFLIGWFLPF